METKHSFLKGFLLGAIFKDKLCDLLKFGISLWVNTINRNNSILNTDGINGIYLVCFINNDRLFENTFPDKIVPPLWDYSEITNTIKISLDDLTISENPISFADLILDTTLDYFLLTTFSDVYLYCDYTIQNKKYTKIYSEGSIISKNDLVLNKNTEVICANLRYYNKIEYLTLYFNSFFNNYTKDTIITPKMLLVNYPRLTKEHLEGDLFLINRNSHQEYSINEPIRVL